MVIFGALLVDAEDADVPGMVMPAGIDAAADLELQFAQIALAILIGEARRDLLCDRDRAGIGEAAIIETGAGGDVADQVEIGRCQTRRVERLPHRIQVRLAHVRQHDVLRVGHPQFVEAVAFGEIGHQVDLLGSGVAGDATGGLQADRDDRITGLLVRGGVLRAPCLEIPVRVERSRDAGRGRRCLDFARHERGGRGVGGDEGGRCKHRGDAVELRLGRIEPERFDVRELFLDLAAIFVGTQLMDQDLDPRLVDIVASAIAIVDAQARLDIAQQIVGGHEILDLGRDHRGAAHAAADINAPAEHAIPFQQLNADVVQPHRRAIFLGPDHRDLELARKVAEFRVEGAPLAQQFRPDARIGDLVGGSPGILVGRDISDAIAAGLDRVHLDRRQIGKDVGRVGQLDPIILDVLPRGEMAVAAIVFARDRRQHPHLAAVERAIGNGDAQHIGVELQIQAVHQPQRLELVLGDLPRKAALHLIAKFLDARVDDLLVVLVVFIHCDSRGGAETRRKEGKLVRAEARRTQR